MNIKVSVETIEGTMDTVRRMVVGKKGGKRGASAVQMYDRSRIKIHRGLFGRVMLPEEEVMIQFCQSNSLVSRSSRGHELKLIDKIYYRIKVSDITGNFESESKVENSRCRYETMGEVCGFFNSHANKINPGYCVTVEDGYVNMTESFYNLSNKNHTETSIHTGFSKIMKVLGVDPGMGKFLVSEPNNVESLEPGVVEYNEFTEKFQVKGSMVKLDNVGYINRTSRWVSFFLCWYFLLKRGLT